MPQVVEAQRAREHAGLSFMPNEGRAGAAARDAHLASATRHGVPAPQPPPIRDPPGRSSALGAHLSLSARYWSGVITTLPVPMRRARSAVHEPG
jgi:hypothetical protein